MLTKGLDNVPGTSGNDTIIGSVDAAANVELNTLSALDIINGGAGIDTLKVSTTQTGAVPLNNLTNVEIVEVTGTAAVTVDTTATTGVTDLNIVAAGGAINADAGATTNVSVAMKAAGAAVDVDGGNNVTVKLTDVAANTNAVTIGTDADVGGPDLGVAPKGDVVVEMTGKAYSTSAAAATLSNVTVTGGKTVSVTQKAAADTAAAAADTSNVGNGVTQGNITVNANADTTTVTVKQDATVAAKDAVNTTGGVTETSSVKFGALKATDSLTVNGLTFTAKVDMTAAEVASAFSNLVDGKLPVAGDTQSSGLASKGTYTNAFTTTAGSVTGWTSAAANGDTVVFTAAQANVNATDLTFTGATVAGSVAPVQTKVQGKAHDATAAGGVMGVTAGAVTIAGEVALKTVTVDGYSANGSAITGTATALETLNLSNGGNFAVANAAETLALNLKNVGTAAKAASLTDIVGAAAAAATLDIDATTNKTLNVKSDGVNTVALDLAGAGTTTLNVSGTGLLNANNGTASSVLTTIKVTETAGLSLNKEATANVTSVDTTGTTGAVTVTIDGGKATYAGGAGKDSVTVGAVTGGVFNKTINLGAGDDTLTLTDASLTAAVLKAIPTANALQGGEGTDTIVLTAANAVELSADAVFAGKIDGFEKLSVEAGTVAGTINLANLDNINYVISKNNSSTGSSAAVGETQTLALGTTTGSVTGGNITVGGVVVAVTANMTTTALGTAIAAALNGAVASGALAGKTLASFDSVTGNVTITFNNTVNPAALTVGSSTTELSAALPAAFTETTPYVAPIPNATPGLVIDNMASGGTLELTATGAGAVVNVKDALTGTADVLNVAANAATGDLGVVKAADVETINVSVANKTATFSNVYGTVNVADAASVSTLALDANAAKVVNVTGAGGLTLDIAAATKVAAVDASTATGPLTLNLAAHNGVAVTVTGGKGNDVLTASQGATAKADVLVGGEGNDTLNAGSNGAKLTGGEGNDVFVLSAVTGTGAANATGSKEVNTYSSITDFQAGDLLQIAGLSGTNQFAKLTATLNENTSVFSNFADAAILQAKVGEAVWFQFKGNAYVVVDQAGSVTTAQVAGTAGGTSFENGYDTVIELVGVDLSNASFNATNGTIALV